MTELQTRFLAALRSGDYKQGIGSLKTIRDNYCCLGVACDVLDPSRWAKSATGWDYIVKDGGKAHSYWPSEIGEAYGLPAGSMESSNPEITINGVTDSAANHNDERKTFAQIADGFEQLFRSMGE